MRGIHNWTIICLIKLIAHDGGMLEFWSLHQKGDSMSTPSLEMFTVFGACITLKRSKLLITAMSNHHLFWINDT